MGEGAFGEVEEGGCVSTGAQSISTGSYCVFLLETKLAIRPLPRNGSRQFNLLRIREHDAKAADCAQSKSHPEHAAVTGGAYLADVP